MKWVGEIFDALAGCLSFPISPWEQTAGTHCVLLVFLDEERGNEEKIECIGEIREASRKHPYFSPRGFPYVVI
jgi:hypothetical protein